MRTENARSSRLNHLLLVGQIGANSVIGFVFSRMLSAMFGLSSAKDGFDIAYSVPYFVLNCSGFAFGHAVIATHFARLRIASPEKLQSAFSTLLNTMLLVGLVLMAGCVVADRQLITLLAPGLDPEVQEQTRRLMLLMLPLTLTLGVGTYLSAVLTAFSVPVSSELCQLASRLGIVAWYFLIGPTFGLEAVAMGLVAASPLALIYEWRLLARHARLRYTLALDMHDPEFRAVLGQCGAFLVAAISAQFSMAHMRRLATLDGPGTNAMLTCCFALVSPVSIIVGKPLAMVMGPAYARLLAANQHAAAQRVLWKSFAVTLTAGVATSGVLMALAPHVIKLLFFGGQFDLAAVASTAQMCRSMVWALPAAVVLWVVLMPILSKRNAVLPATIYTVGYVLQMVLSAILFPRFGQSGIIAGYLVAINSQALVSIVVLYWEASPSHAARSTSDGSADVRLPPQRATAVSRELHESLGAFSPWLAGKKVLHVGPCRDNCVAKLRELGATMVVAHEQLYPVATGAAANELGDEGRFDTVIDHVPAATAREIGDSLRWASCMVRTHGHVLLRLPSPANHGNCPESSDSQHGWRSPKNSSLSVASDGVPPGFVFVRPEPHTWRSRLARFLPRFRWKETDAESHCILQSIAECDARITLGAPPIHRKAG